jgi:hypothetical protein
MMQPRASLFGGNWWNDDDAGSRQANVAYNFPGNSNENFGARGRSDDLMLIAARQRSRSRRRITLSQGWWSARLSCFGEHTSRSGRAGRSGRINLRLSRPAAGFSAGAS